jgi:DNA-binding IclR family transcriptional regulator
LSALAEEILAVLSKKRRMAIMDVPDRFNVTKETAKLAVDFLLKFGFVEMEDDDGQIKLSEPCAKFFAEIKD